MDCTTRVQLPAAAESFYLLHSVQTCSGAQPASYPVDIGGSFPGGSRDVQLIIHLNPVLRLRRRGAITPLPNTSLWHEDWLSTG